MTDIKAYINEIKSVRRQAEKASIAKSEFLANMSHEIRTPMNAIVGLSDIIMEESRGAESIRLCPRYQIFLPKPIGADQRYSRSVQSRGGEDGAGKC